MTTSLMVFHDRLAQSKVNRTLMERAAREADDAVIVRDMYALYPDFAIDVDEEHRVCERCDRLAFLFPFYWYSAPALMKQWEDAVFTPGWAYGGGDALAGKTMLLAVTTGGARDMYTADGKHGATMDALLLPYRITARYLGLEYEDPFIVHGSSKTIDDDALAQVADDFVAWLRA
ncbi:NAD(P)H-dependent oxidoreductase [Bifidobacterium criceti]|uniref:NAD(P)H oxidoreductase n=1 Tax=Bifidobacterium criceti TaxID=1960969 RepID=A0A2A2EHF9_9BIFI|nr:NAD(P)H-dependent oxidoreductase [Bifidobacterium criceti]PAU68345.1 NAD(P)H oxidoreductase [Bifidobacterium criceti]